MNSICGADCSNCGFGNGNGCKGCCESGGCPFGKQCYIASCIKAGGMESFEELKKQIMAEFNELNIPGMPEITQLNPVVGAYINLSYPLPNGKEISFLNDDEIYLAAQVPCELNDEHKRCFGLVAGLDFLLVSEYGENGSDPQIAMFKRR